MVISKRVRSKIAKAYAHGAPIVRACEDAGVSRAAYVASLASDPTWTAELAEADQKRRHDQRLSSRASWAGVSVRTLKRRDRKNAEENWSRNPPELWD